MNKKIMATLGFAWILVLSLPAFATAKSVDNLYFSTEIYPPFNLQEKGVLKGISVDLLVAMFKKMKAKSTINNIHLSPWSRGYRTALKKKNACIFSTTRTAVREDKFQWVGPIIATRISLFAKKNRHIIIQDMNDVKAYRIGVISGDIGEQLLLHNGISAKNMDRMSGINVILPSLKKLIKGRIDLFSYGENATKWTIKNSSLHLDDFEVVHILKSGELYYACNKKTPKKIIQQLQQTLDQLKQDGTLQKIIDQYLIPSQKL